MICSFDSKCIMISKQYITYISVRHLHCYIYLRNECICSMIMGNESERETNTSENSFVLRSDSFPSNPERKHSFLI